MTEVQFTDPTVHAIQAQAELGALAPGAALDPVAVAAQGKAENASVTSVDLEALLAQLQALQARVTTMEAGAAAGTKPTLVGLTGHLLASLKHRAGALGGGNTVLDDAVKIAEDLAGAAEDAVSSGDGSAVTKLGARLVRELSRTASAASSAVTSYVAQLADYDLPDAVDALQPAKA